MKGAKEELFTDLSYQVVQDLAPNELRLFKTVNDEFLKDPDTFIKKTRGKKKEKALGGGAIIGQLILPIILPAIWSALTFLYKTGLDAGKEITAEKLKETIRALAEGKNSKERLKEIRDCVLQSLKDDGMSDKQAALIADSIIGKLVQK